MCIRKQILLYKHSVSFLSLCENISIKKELQFVLLCTTPPHCSPVSVGLDQQGQSPGAPCYPEPRIWAEQLEGLTRPLDTVNYSLHNQVHRQVLRSSQKKQQQRQNELEFVRKQQRDYFQKASSFSQNKGGHWPVVPPVLLSEEKTIYNEHSHCMLSWVATPQLLSVLFMAQGQGIHWSGCIHS